MAEHVNDPLIGMIVSREEDGTGPMPRQYGRIVRTKYLAGPKSPGTLVEVDIQWAGFGKTAIGISAEYLQRWCEVHPPMPSDPGELEEWLASDEPPGLSRPDDPPR